MAVAEMRKLNLVAMSYDRDEILNALQRTGAAEIKSHTCTENAVPLELDGSALSEAAARTERALEILEAGIDEYNKENKIKTDDLKNGFTVTYSEFMSAGYSKERADAVTERIFSLDAERKMLTGRISKLGEDLASATIYSKLLRPFSDYRDRSRVRVRLGVISSAAAENLNALSADEPFAFEVLNVEDGNSLIACAFHKFFEGDNALGALNFAQCPYSEGTGAGLCEKYRAEREEAKARLKEIANKFKELGEEIKTLKIYCDYLLFELEKLDAGGKMLKTDATFLLEAYVPKTAEQAVGGALDEVSSAVYYEFSDPGEDEMPPTLYKNNKVVENFETITNMYSPVNAREFDPNAVMAFFYSLFLGFIMGDVGYGAIMFLGGGFVYFKKRGEDGGLKRLAGVFAIGGIFAIIWGFLFNSIFGIPMFASSIIPDAQRSRWSLMGIQVPSVLLISLEVGVCHLMVGYICRAVQCMRRGQFWDGIFEGLVWAVFSIGVGLAIAGLIDEAEMPMLAYVGGITAGAMLVVAMLTAGRKEKLLGKFTKGFGAAYGIINYASDILSYASLYGLMLSGAVIAQIISGYAVTGMNGSTGFLMSGNPALIILGVILLIVGHTFNLAIGLLGAYIHDARLQYVEFYGRFFEGEGELFAPLGSNHKFIKLEKVTTNGGFL